jgi:hypothetical protein
MNHEQAQTNPQLVLDWIDALRRGNIDAIAGRFHPDVAWVDVAGGVACEGASRCSPGCAPRPASRPMWTRSSCSPTPTTSCSASATMLVKSSPACSSTGSCSRSSRSARGSDRPPARPRPPRQRARRRRALLPMALTPQAIGEHAVVQSDRSPPGTSPGAQCALAAVSPTLSAYGASLASPMRYELQRTDARATSEWALDCCHRRLQDGLRWG